MDRGVLVVSRGVVLREVVVDLGVDRVVEAPRGDRGHGDGHAEEPVALQGAAERHETSVRPPVDADACGVDPRLCGHVAGRGELILDLQGPESSVCCLLELLAAASRAASVGADDDIPLVDQGILPVDRPAVGDRLRSRARILGQQHGVAVRGVESAGFDDVGVEGVAALGGEGEELLHGALRGGELLAQRAAVGERADRLAGGVADRHHVGGRGVGEGRDEVLHPLARGDRIVSLPGGEALLVLPVEAHAVEVAAQGRGLGREVPHAFSVRSDDVGHLPGSFCHLREESAAQAVEVEVHVSGVALLPHEEAVLVDEGHGLVIDALDVLLRALLIDRALCAVGFADPHLEDILPAVEAVVPGPSVGGPADAGDVLVGLLPGVDALLGACREVGDPQLDDRIALPGLRIFERIGLVVELSVEAHHLHQGHLALVEAQEGDLPAVGREGVGPGDPELLFVDPVRRAVDYLVPASVVGDAARRTAFDVVDIEVVAVGVCDQASVGRERCVARGLGLREDRLHGIVAH